ncbi:unnamed protein product [Paramecium pentaurelia]|uniref:Uncharacterized protein n=1 Tax=Paramecium pentaurelia TaxID=43138 RepID=A0A8S1Y5R7_9CILI|nr:unnamed protein product [Paramecium pentaurelia]
MLNSIECFIEVLQLQQPCDGLVSEVQQFLDFDMNKVLQQDQRKIVQDPILLINWFNQIEDHLSIKQDENDTYITPMIQVQVMLINSFIYISNQNLLQEYFYLFEVLQKKILYLKIYQPNELTLSALEQCYKFEQCIDCNKISQISMLIYKINQFNSSEKIDQFYQFIIKFDQKKHKLVDSQANLIIYSYYLILQQCCQLVEENKNLETVISVCLNIKEELKKSDQNYLNQCNQCILLSYYKLNKINDFIQYSKQYDLQKTTPLEIQLLILIVKIKEFQSEIDFEKVRNQVNKMFQQFLDNNLMHSVTDILILLKELSQNIQLYPINFILINQWFQFKYNLILRASNQQNIMKLSKDIHQMLLDFPQLLNINNYNDDQITLLNHNLIGNVIDLCQLIFTIVQHIQKYQEVCLDEFFHMILLIIPNFANDSRLTKQFGQLITLLSNLQIKESQILQHLAMFLNLEFGILPQTQTTLFQNLLKNYKSGIITGTLLFLKEFQSNNKQENRLNLCKQLKSLLEESYQLIDSNSILFYAILESCIRNQQIYYYQIVINFFVEYKPTLDQHMYYFLLNFIEKCIKQNDTANVDQLYQLLYQYIASKKSLPIDLCKQSYNMCTFDQSTLAKQLVKLHTFFMISMQMDTCTIQFIKDTVMGNNQYKYQWKVENNKSLFIIVSEILEQIQPESQFKLELINIKHLFELLFYLIEQNTKMEVDKVIPYSLRQIIKMAYKNKLDDFVCKILLISFNHENLFLFLLLELQSYEGNRQLMILKKFIYEQQIPLYGYLLVICQIVEQSDTLETILEMLPQLNQILRTTPVDDNLKQFTQLLYLKLNALKEYVPIGKIDMICQSISLLSI